ncbi:MAG: hypothetical protein J0L97_01620 [Alphaproteobacteria bacterium]|nr:hypothetical protein [Alphaproteobacteria bacterium]
MSSKNNPENRGRVTELRKYNGKKVQPVMYINPTKGTKYIAAQYEDGNLVIDPSSKMPIAYKKI